MNKTLTLFLCALVGLVTVWALVNCWPLIANANTAPVSSMRLVEKNTEGMNALRVFHDDVRGVTCWVQGEGISCLPDSALLHPGEVKP